MKLAPSVTLSGFDAEVLHDDLLHPLGNITHRFHPRVFLMGLRRATRAVAASSWRKAACRRTARGIDRWPPMPGCPDQAGVRLPYFPKLGQHAQPASATSRKCVTYHRNRRRVTTQMSLHTGFRRRTSASREPRADFCDANSPMSRARP